MSPRFMFALALAMGCSSVEFLPRKPVALDRAPLRGVTDSNAAPFPSSMPSASPAVARAGSVAEEFKLKNGIRVLLFEEHASPLVAIGVVIQRGSVEAPPGVFDLFVDAMSRGSDLIAPKAFDIDVQDTYAIVHRAGARAELSVVSAQFVAPLLHDVVRIVVPAIAHPLFDSDDFERVLDRHRRRVTAQRDEAGATARRELAKLLFPSGHPYAASDDVDHPLDGVTRDAVLALQTCVASDDVAVVAAGDVQRAQLEPLLEDVLGSMKPGARARKPIADAPPPAASHVLLLDHPHDTQAQIALGFITLKYDSPDYPALFVLSRLVQSAMYQAMRRGHGSTYGTSSELAMMHANAPLIFSAAVDVDQVGQALRDTFGTISNLETELRKPDTLARAKNMAAHWASYETVDAAVASLSTLAAFDLPVDHWVKLKKGVEALTTEDLLRVAKQYLDLAHAELVVLGDVAHFQPDVEALKIGDIEVRKVAH
jgi:predicted Zn-dependent peptidase